jgi:hypothetical protein
MNKKDDKETPQHTGSVVAEDEALTTWLNRLWAREEPPERVELWQMFGRNKITFGEMIHHEDFKLGAKKDPEAANKLANEIIEAAQNDCDGARRESFYSLRVIDRNRKASPLTRRLGPYQPKRNYALASLRNVDTEDSDDEDSPIDPKTLDLKYLREGMEQVRWDKQRSDKVMGDVILMLGSMTSELRQQNTLLFQQNMALFEKSQELQDRALDRELLREKERFKLSLYKDGLRTARNLLPGLFGGGDNNGAAPANGSNGTNSANSTNGAKYGTSAERTLVDNFLSDIEEDENLAIALFGDFEERDGKLVQIKEGIFSFKQFEIFIKVRKGAMSPDELDRLMPNSGNELAITQEQVAKAGDAGVTEGIGTALLELVALRSRRKAELEAKPETT